MIGIGLVGFGYWGPNLARNFNAQPDCRLAAICEKKPEQAKRAAKAYQEARITSSYREMLDNGDIQAVAIATPVSTHFELASEALRAGKDVLLEKPLTQTTAEAEKLIEIADGAGRILAVDHTFIYTGAVKKMKEIIASGELGEIIYIDSTRVNLGLFQQDVNVVYDLAPHDLAIALHLLDKDPLTVQAVGARHAESAMEYLAHINLDFGNNVLAHFHLNWLSPVKIRRMLVAGSNKMIVYDDMEFSEKVKVYDKGIDIKKDDTESLYKIFVDYRTGDMVAPKLENREALDAEAEHFLSCVKNRARPITDARSGLKVVKIIEAAQTSILNKGALIELGDFR